MSHRPEIAPAQAPIAIVGLAGTFAGARDVGEYWSNILHEVDSITDVPPSHFAIEDYYDPDPRAPDKTYSRRGGFIPEHEFNPLEFGLPPNILELTDIAQLLSLVVASRALADAGYAVANPHAERTGVVLGVSALSLVGPLSARLQYPIWQRVLRARSVPEPEIDAIIETIKKAYVEWREDSFPGYLSNVVPGRIANRLNLGGINCSVDAACASSMASIQFAMHELRSHGCDVMLAGGVDTNNTPMGFVSFSKTPAFTKHDHMRPFDAASDGMLIGEGVGMLVLRRLEDAQRDGQRVYAVIRGVGASSDGRFSSIYAPRQAGQELALRRAYQEAGVSPSSVGMLEAHGTGTPTGDPTELAALQAVIGGDTGAQIALGSVKSQIGHTKVAAGAASLIKAALALHEKVLPPTINVDTPHPAIRAPFYVNTRARPWFATTPRRAGVSSFGFGGTNFHVVLEEHGPAKPESLRAQATPYALFLHALGTQALAELCTRVAGELREDTGARRFRELVQASKSEAISAEAARVGFVALNREEAIARLEEAAIALARPGAAAPAKFHFSERALDVHGRVVVVFPGQGSQAVDMGASICANFPPAHEAFARMDAVRLEQGLLPITEIVYPPPVFAKSDQDEQSQRLRSTNNAQAAIGALNLGFFAILRRCGLAPDFLAGHSLGELSALCAGGAYSEQDYLSLLIARGEAMAQPPPSGVDPGTLLAVGGDTAMLEEFLRDRPGVTVANRNSRSQLVVAGSLEELGALKAELAALGVTATLLPVSGAFHSTRVAHAQAPFARALEGIQLHEPAIPTFANTTGAPYPSSAEAVRSLLADQLLRPVEFRREIEAIHDAGGRIFVECGPGRVLTGLIGNILSDRPHLAIAVNRTKANDDDLSLREAYVQLRVAGVELTDLDPWQALPEAPEKKRGPIVRLSGTSYKSESTHLAFEKALVVAPRADLPAPVSVLEASPPLAIEEAFERTPEAAMVSLETKTDLGRVVPFSGDARTQAHVQYLEHLAGCSTRYFELSQQLFALATNPACSPTALAAFERAFNHFHELQLGAQQVHSQFLNPQGGTLPRERPAASEPTAPVEAPKAVAIAPKPAAQPEVASALPSVASAPAPRPVPVVKEAPPVRKPETNAAVAIAAPRPVTQAPKPETNGVHHGAIARPAPPAPRPEMNGAPRPAPARSMPPAPPAPKPAAAPPPAPVAKAAAAPRAAAGADEIAKILLAVISEKTGYPLDTLDVSMDVDTDLGIDSLKRVEIMAALEGRLFKSLSGIDFSSFATKRTVSDIADYLAEVR